MTTLEAKATNQSSENRALADLLDRNATKNATHCRLSTWNDDPVKAERQAEHRHLSRVVIPYRSLIHGTDIVISFSTDELQGCHALRLCYRSGRSY